MMGYYLIAGLIFIVSMYVSNKLKSKFKHYSKLRLQNGMSGKEIAEKMLADNGITDVQVISAPGMLTDHYNPINKTVNLSEGAFHERNAAADRKSTRLNSSHVAISYAVFCLKNKKSRP